jgi:hypothetical protein
VHFEEAFSEFIQSHIKRRKVGRLQQLGEEYGHAEKIFLKQVWWPAFGNFDYLHPEYEVSDFKDGVRYIDFAYIRKLFRIAIEIDGYGPDWKEQTKWQFSDSHNRQNDLMIDRWFILRFTYDDLEIHPRRCQQKIQQMIGRWLIDSKNGTKSSFGFVEREVIKLAATLEERDLTPGDVSDYVEVGRKKAVQLLQGLVKKGVFEASGGRDRIRSYKLISRDQDIIM